MFQASTLNLLSTTSNHWLQTSDLTANNGFLSANSDTPNAGYFAHDLIGDLSYDLNNNIAPKYDVTETVDLFAPPRLGAIPNFQLSPSTSSHGSRALAAFPPSSESSPSHSKSSQSDTDPYSNWNTDLFPKPKASILDLNSPFDQFPEKFVYASDTGYKDKQIEVILQEALEALARGNLNEDCE